MTFKSLPVKSEDKRMDIREISLNFDEDEFELVFADHFLKCYEINKIKFLENLINKTYYCALLN